MHLGMDFGTTRTVVAHADRGNYPVVAFTDDDGDFHEYFPSLIADVGGQLRSGFAAITARAKGYPALRSVKRALADSVAAESTTVRIGERDIALSEVLIVFLKDLYTALHTTSTIAEALARDPIESVVVAVPAHANSAQRFWTLESFSRAGFPVTGMLNEPSAAGFEYTHRLTSSPSAKRSRLLVYDLGGGTFDASLVSIIDTSHQVLGSVGLNHLGGDDFDIVLADLACETAGIVPDELGVDGYFDLLTQAQAAKEQLQPQSRRILLEVGDHSVTVPVADFYARSAPLVAQTLSAMGDLVDGLDQGEPDLSEIAGFYLVGGASVLPLVPRTLREHFGRRVYRSPYPAASTAIGLAIAADPASEFTLSDRLSRGFGVFREVAGGQGQSFDSIFDRSQVLSSTMEVRVQRQYRAAHNLGWYRFVEYTELANGRPSGNVVPMNDVRFGFEERLQSLDLDLSGIEVVRTEEGHLIEESYVIDPHGIVQVTITDTKTGHSSTHQLGIG